MTPEQQTALKEALRLAREWLTEFSPTEHRARCQRLLDAGIPGCTCAFDNFRADLKRIDAAILDGALAKPDVAVVTLIEIIDGLQKKLCAAQDEIAALKLAPVTPQP